MSETNSPILFFDGVCPLCVSFVKLLLRIDRHDHFQIAPLQGTTARKCLEPDEYEKLRTVVLYKNGRKWIKSDAVLEVFKTIGAPWSFFSFFSFLPKRLRDKIYQVVSVYRYRIFGRYENLTAAGLPKDKRILE